VAAVVSQAKLAAVHGAGPDRTVEVDTHAAAIAALPVTPPPREDDAARLEDVAYVLYTSGSTGKPKGVRVPHRAAINFLASMRAEPGLSAGDRLLAVTTLSFDIALLELMLPLSVGAQVILASREQAMDGEALRRLIEAHGVTVMQATPVTWRLLLASGWVGGPAFKALCGGEALSPALAEALGPKVGALWNMYGPTETTVWSTCGRVESAGPEIDIGRPIANTTVWILDRNGSVCPIGVPGEIHIGGDGVALGYLNRPELTADRFIADPFAGAPGARMYRTGDLGRWRADGRLECLGRLDHQIKVRGFRIEPGEIESALLKHPAVIGAVVTAYADGNGGEAQLVAYLVVDPSAGAPIDRETLRAHLKRSLPDYMVPQHFMKLDALPLTPNGKVDRKALPAPVPGEPTRSDSHVAPRSPLEHKVAAIWSDILGVVEISIDQTFFDLGGTSVLLVEARSRIEEEFGVELPLRAFFEAPTIESMVRHLSVLTEVA
jgi:amino acid adenylation domain-containing protein